MRKVKTINTPFPGTKIEVDLSTLASQYYSGFGFRDLSELDITGEYLKRLYAIAKCYGLYSAIWHEIKATTFSSMNTLFSSTPIHIPEFKRIQRYKSILNGTYRKSEAIGSWEL